MTDKNLIISPAAADRLLARGDAAAALLYLHILRRGGFAPEKAVAELGLSMAAVSSAAATLRELGLLPSAGDKKLLENREMPEYSAADIVSRAGRDSIFELLVDDVQQRLGKLLSTPDLKTLFGIYDHLGLPAEVIMLLITHCIETYRESHGEGRMPTLRYIEKEAWYWAGQEIMSLDAAEEHIKREQEKKSLLYRAAEALQIHSRQLSPGERKYIEGWLDMGFGPEALAMAYDRTILGTGKLAWRYMDKIVQSWHEKGLHSPAEIASGDARQTRRPVPAAAASTPAGNDREIEEMRRLHAYLKNKES